MKSYLLVAFMMLFTSSVMASTVFTCVGRDDKGKYFEIFGEDSNVHYSESVSKKPLMATEFQGTPKQFSFNLVSHNNGKIKVKLSASQYFGPPMGGSPQPLQGVEKLFVLSGSLTIKKTCKKDIVVDMNCLAGTKINN